MSPKKPQKNRSSTKNSKSKTTRKGVRYSNVKSKNRARTVANPLELEVSRLKQKLKVAQEVRNETIVSFLSLKAKIPKWISDDPSFKGVRINILANGDMSWVLKLGDKNLSSPSEVSSYRLWSKNKEKAERLLRSIERFEDRVNLISQSVLTEDGKDISYQPFFLGKRNKGKARADQDNLSSKDHLGSSDKSTRFIWKEPDLEWDSTWYHPNPTGLVGTPRTGASPNITIKPLNDLTQINLGFSGSPSQTSKGGDDVKSHNNSSSKEESKEKVGFGQPQHSCYALFDGSFMPSVDHMTNFHIESVKRSLSAWKTQLNGLVLKLTSQERDFLEFCKDNPEGAGSVILEIYEKKHKAFSSTKVAGLHFRSGSEFVPKSLHL